MSLNVNLLLARCYGQLGQTDKELEAYQRALQIDGSSLPAARGMISVLVRLQQYEQAYRWLQGLRRALGDEEFTKDRELAGAFYQVVLVLQRQRPGNRDIASDVELARKLMYEAVGEGRSSETLLAADRLLKDKDLGRAAARLREALRKQPEDERLQRTYLRVVIEQNGPAAGLTLLDTAQNAVRGGWKDTAHFRIVKSQLLSSLSEPEVRAKLAALEIGIDKFSQSDQFQLWRVLGAAYYNLSPRGFDSAQRCWENAATLRPTELDLVHLLFDLSRERSDELGLAATMDLVQKTFGPASPEADYFRALKLIGNYQRDLTDRSDLDEATVIAEELAKRRPTWNWVALLQAQISDLQGQPQSAILEYQRALELGPVRPAAVRRLVELLMADARYQEARIALGHLKPVPKEMLRYKVLLEAMGGDRQQALSALSDAIDIDSLNPDDFLWKGRVLNQLQKPDDATKAFFRAVQLNPNLPQAWLTLIEHLVRNGRSRDAENFTRQAENHLATDRAPLVLGQAYALLGNYSLAEQYYQTALAAAPEDPILGRSVAAYYLATDQRPEAERQLKKILQLTDSSQPSLSTHAVWARRMLAQVLAKDGGYLRFRTALALLDTNRVAGELDEMDLRIKAELLGARVEPDFRQEALRILESLQDGAKPLSLQQRMLLARLYDQSGRWNQARNLMIDLVSENPENADLLANLSEMLLDRQEVDLSGRWTDKLARIEPSSYRTLRLRALVLSARRENEEALKLIDAWLPKPLKTSDANQVLQVATLLEELKFPRAAEKKFTTFDQLSSGRSLALARFMARQGHLDQAFQLAANRVNNENVRDVARLAIFAITQFPLRVTDAHFGQAREWYEQALAQSSNDLSLKLNWSSVLAVLGKSEEAESILKKALDADLTTQQKGIVINNLAYLRAVRGATDADALRLVDTAAKLIGPHPSVLDSLAMIHLSQGHCSRAIEQLEEATRFGVDSGLYYFHLALAHQCASDRSSAKQALEEAERLGFSRQQLGVGEQQRYQQLESWLAL
jgi:tetratricopeptide (TPR) repeat protein